MTRREPVGFRKVTDPVKLSTLARLLIAPMTPREFRTLIKSEPDFLFAGLLYDSILKNSLRKKRVDPRVAEIQAMIDLKVWWLNELHPETVNRLSEAYLKTASKFMINLTRHYPYKNNPPYMILRNGLPPWELKRILEFVFTPGLTAEIISQIGNKGGPGHYYEVWIRERGRQSGQFDVVVTNITNDPKKLREYGYLLPGGEKEHETSE